MERMIFRPWHQIFAIEAAPKDFDGIIHRNPIGSKYLRKAEGVTSVSFLKARIKCAALANPH